MIAEAITIFTRKKSGARRRLWKIGCLLGWLLALGMLSPCARSDDKRRFTVADDVKLSHFGDPYTAQAEPITFSPDGRYFVVDTERGRIDLNRPESTLRVYRTEDVEKFLRSSQDDQEAVPFWIVTKSSFKDGPIITNIRWLADSSAFGFLAKNALGNDQLFLGDVQTKRILTLTRTTQQVMSFDIRDRTHYVYCIQSPELREMDTREREATLVAAQGHNIYGLIFGGNDDLHFTALAGYDLSELWAVVDGRMFRVHDTSGEPIPIRSDGQQALALSPDGQWVVTALAVRNIPAAWESMYPSAYPSGGYRIRSGQQNPAAPDESVSTSEYVRIRLADGQVRKLTGAPIGSAAGWWAFLRAAWSSDGESVVLPDTFLPPDPSSHEAKAGPPCAAVVEILTGIASCVERLRGEPTDYADEKSLRTLYGVSFAAGSNTRVAMRYLLPDGSEQTEYHSRGPGGSWSAELPLTQNEEARGREIQVFVKESMNAPPVLVGTDHAGESKTIWNPNPQLKQIALGEESVMRWKDATGRDWIGGLYKPPDYAEGVRYPLVIQTHGFREKSFDPAGVFPTAFAAQELAAAEMIVLQVEDCPVRLETDEASCQIAGYEAAVKQLAATGLIDPDRVGIIGFSRTCYYVMQALTETKLHLRAASITDGIVLGYVEYIMHCNLWNNEGAHEADTMIGAPPFGEGLEAWLKHSPEFNLDKITAPLQVVARGRQDLLTMWEPYAGLRYLKKPVDLILLPDEGTHVLTNPAQRIASQTATVDWFRYWLKDEVDHDSQKREQYDRWQGLRNLQEASLQGAGSESISPSRARFDRGQK